MLTIIPNIIIALADVVAAFLFLFGLKRMSSPVTAPSGILFAGVGMVVAILGNPWVLTRILEAAAPLVG